MSSQDLLNKIRRIEITARHAVTDILAGQYHSVFKGRGMEFDEVRLYQQGDDIRSIDWNVTARTGETHIKKYVEERELTVFLLVDASGSGVFGSTGKSKGELAAELSGLLAFSAIRNNDRVGLLVFTDSVELYVPPARGTQHVLRVIREVLAFKPKGKKTSITEALATLGRVTRKKAVVFLISDFIDTGFEKRLRIANKRHDVVAMVLHDTLEDSLPNLGLVEMEDAETGSVVTVDTSDSSFRHSYESASRMRRQELKEIFGSAGIDSVNLCLGEELVTPLVTFFRSRAKRLNR